MKASYIIPPAVALGVVIVWSVSQWRSISSEEDRGRELRDRIAADGSGGSGGSPATRKERKERDGGGGSGVTGDIDWKRVSGKMVDMMDGDESGLMEMTDFQTRVSEMSAAEIVASLDEISAMELDDDEKEVLEELMVEELIEKDPKLVLEKFADRLGDEDDPVTWQMPTAFAEWLTEDPAAAKAWFDGRIADGSFESKSLDGQSETRLAFEAELVGVLLESDYNGARDRIAALPEDQRREALESISFSDLESGAQQGYASLVRELVPQDEQAGSLSYIMFDLTLEGGYERVDAFLDSIKATPEERAVSAREAANSRLQDISTERALTAADVDEMRTWLGRQAPGTVDQVTGEAIGDAAQEGGEEFNFAAASELVLKYHESTGNDEILVAFLESYAAHSNLEEALPLAEKISDPKLREEVLEELR